MNKSTQIYLSLDKDSSLTKRIVYNYYQSRYFLKAACSPRALGDLINNWEDFTRANYLRLLKSASNRFRLGPIADVNDKNITALWRHDVDCSPQGALSIGLIENAENIRSTYYFNLRSEFYNLLEAPNAEIVTKLYSMGHEVGLHFDAAQSDISTASKLEASLDKEKLVFEKMLGIPLRSFSFHNPSDTTKEYKSSTYAGLINAYSADIMSDYAYCSDSNGYWRFTPLSEFLYSSQSPICVLTHPEWWTELPMSPRDRVWRCVEGRAKATMQQYDDLLAKHGRMNIR